MSISPIVSSPFLPVQGLFKHAQTTEQKQACLRYLLHYQHYNAEFTISECRRLGYPLPLCAAQEFPGYVRTDAYHRLVPLLDPWIRPHVLPFIERQFVKVGSSEYSDFIRLSTLEAPKILRTLFRETMERVTVIDLTPADLRRPLKEKIPSGDRDSKQLFLFILKNGEIDCALLFAAKWRAPKKNRDLQCLMLDSSEMFGAAAFSLLNRAGDVPDRAAVNRFLTYDLGREEFDAELRRIGMEMPKDTATSFTTMEATFRLTDDPGCRLYDRAIKRWRECFFKKYGLIEFASSLLESQVAPWMSEEAGILGWSKAYQNMCEIVLFCLESFPEKFTDLNFEKSILAKLDQEGSLAQVKKTVGLYSYAMAPVFPIFYSLREPVSVACITQNYYETLELLKQLDTKGRIRRQEADSLEQIVGTPDVLIADIHPNNASRDILHSNEVDIWVENYLNTHLAQSLVLILDITLNNLTDVRVQRLLKRLAPFIAAGRLELFWIQSLAKLVQLGADNLSGGVCGYLGTRENVLSHPPAPPHKAAFFALMNDNFPDLIAGYFEQVRQNTEWMSQTLRSQFDYIKNGVKVQSRGFCAADVTTSGDDKTVYVALNFKPFLELSACAPEQTEPVVKKIHQLILSLAELKGLPLAARQSFGFSLSNLSLAGDKMRFSIGIEKRVLLQKYAYLIGTFCEMLSRYTAEHSVDIELKGFEQALDTLRQVWKEGEYPPRTVSLTDELDSRYRNEGRAVIRFSQHELFVEIPETGTSIRQAALRGSALETHDFQSEDEVLKLLFHLICLDKRRLFVSIHGLDDEMHYGIGGMYRSHRLFYDEGGAIDNGAGAYLVLGDQFCLNVEATRFGKDQVAVLVENLGTRPVKLSQLDKGRLEDVFNQCVRYQWVVEPFEPGVVFLKFLERMPFLDYPSRLAELEAKGGLPAILEYLNDQDSDNLPLPHNHTWINKAQPARGHPIEHRPSPVPAAVRVLCNLLNGRGQELIYVYKDELLNDILGIREERYKHALFKGMVEGLLTDSLKKRSLPGASAQALNRAFCSEGVRHTLDGWRWNAWISDLEELLQNNAGSTSWLRPYLIALSPLIRRLCGAPVALLNTDFSAPLRKVAQWIILDYPELISHMDDLERVLISEASSQVRTPKDITAFLRFYARYPLSDTATSQLFNQLRVVPEEIRAQWVRHPGFYYGPRDGAIDPGEDAIFTEEDVERIREFLPGIGGLSFLDEDAEESWDPLYDPDLEPADGYIVGYG